MVTRELPDRIVNPLIDDEALARMSNEFNRSSEHSRGRSKLKKFGKSVVGVAKTLFLRKSVLEQRTQDARQQFEDASQAYYDTNPSEVGALTSSGREISDDPVNRMARERFDRTADLMEGLERQRFTQRVGRRALIAAGIVGGAVAAWQFKDAAFLSSSLDHASFAHTPLGEAGLSLDTPAQLPEEALLPPAEILELHPKVPVQEGDSWWSIATELWRQNGVAKPDIGQINDVKNILMQANPISDAQGWIYPGQGYNPDTAEAFIKNSISV